MIGEGIAVEVSQVSTARGGMGEAVNDALMVSGGDMAHPFVVIFAITLEVPRDSADRGGMVEAVYFAKIMPVGGLTRPFGVGTADTVEVGGVSAISGVVVALAVEVGGIETVAWGMVEAKIAGFYACITYGMTKNLMNSPQRPVDYPIQITPTSQRKTIRAIHTFHITTIYMSIALYRNMVVGMRGWGCAQNLVQRPFARIPQWR